MAEPSSLQRLLDEAGLEGGPLTPLTGGDMGSVCRLGPWVLKTCAGMPDDFFPTEAQGLRALARAGIRTPGVRHVSKHGLVMDYMPPGPPRPEDLGRQLVALHTQRRGSYGWPDGVFIGRYALPHGRQSDDWPSFWLEERITPLLRETWNRLGRLGPRIEALHAHYTPPIEGPCLLHGDLWGGNMLMTEKGACLIDPSCWAGERGVDLAMMKLFGGFDAGFWRTYDRGAGISRALEDAIPFYQLYYLLVHVHFFGASYLGGVEGALRHYGQ